MIKAYLIRVSGDVQGVNYRHFAKKEAVLLGLCGWTKNEHDGTVKIIVQGDFEGVSTFIDWCKEGSPMATVDGVEVKAIEPDDSLKDFEVK